MVFIVPSGWVEILGREEIGDMRMMGRVRLGRTEGRWEGRVGVPMAGRMGELSMDCKLS